ncbi:hypothetical protein [Agromyces albus]|uniref:hypothetical protein n=1 Tax=Agromyces albus TaxID=205332 RepID=UPI0027D7CBE3|nr:hypothetical protein [Agromyces albus]
MYVGTGLVGMQHSLGHAILVTGTQTTVEGPVVANDDMSVQGDFSAASKSFLIPHPTHADKMLRHGSSESPVHGVEYWGNATIGNDGAARVELPGYFESLALPDGRSVFVTGRGFVPGWTDIQDGAFTVTGTAGSAFSWLVKAARAVFEVEPTKPPTAEGTPE